MSIKDLKVQTYPGHEAKERRECCFLWGWTTWTKIPSIWMYLGGMVKAKCLPFSSQQKGLFAVYNSFFGNKDGGFQWNLSDVSRILRGTYGLLRKGRTCFVFPVSHPEISIAQKVSNDGFHTWPCGRRAGGPIVLARYDRNPSFFLFGWYGWWRFNVEPNEVYKTLKTR